MPDGVGGGVSRGATGGEIVAAGDTATFVGPDYDGTCRAWATPTEAGIGAGSLYAVRPDGTLLWSFSTGLQVMASPAIGSGDGTIYVASWDGSLYALDPVGSELPAPTARR